VPFRKTVGLCQNADDLQPITNVPKQKDLSRAEQGYVSINAININRPTTRTVARI